MVELAEPPAANGFAHTLIGCPQCSAKQMCCWWRPDYTLTTKPITEEDAAAILGGTRPDLPAFMKAWQEKVMGPRLFHIRNGRKDGFFTGVAPDGGQVVMGYLGRMEIPAYFFDAEGTYLGRQSRPWSEKAMRYGFVDAWPLVKRQIKAWQQELGVQPATIRIKQFWLYEPDTATTVGIKELPDYLCDIEAKQYLTEEQRRDLLETRKTWLDDGQFVWWWGNSEFWVSVDGKAWDTLSPSGD